MSNQVEQIRAEVERRIKSWAAGIKYEGDAGDCQSRVTELTDLKKFIDSLPAKETPIEVCGKKVVVRYVEGLSPCPPCVFYEEGCTCLEYCRKFDRGGQTAYFVEAEQQEADLEAEIERYYKENGWIYYVPYLSEFATIARHFAEWGAEHLKR